MIRATIRVVMPAHLRTLAGVRGDVTVEVEGEVTRRTILDALETQYPMLRGTILDHVSGAAVNSANGSLNNVQLERRRCDTVRYQL